VEHPADATGATVTVAVAGEAITDMVPAGEDGLFRASPGGSPANVAVGLARLDVPVRMLARLSQDVLGARLRDHLATNGVDLSRSVAATEPSSLAIVVLQPDGSAAYDFRVDGTADWQWTDDELDGALHGVHALHVGSIALTTPPGGAVLRRLAARARPTATVCFDPNVRHLLMGSPAEVMAVVGEMLPVADVVKASSEDVQWLAPGAEPADVAADWASRGPARPEPPGVGREARAGRARCRDRGCAARRGDRRVRGDLLPPGRRPADGGRDARGARGAVTLTPETLRPIRPSRTPSASRSSATWLRAGWLVRGRPAGAGCRRSKS